MLKFFIAPVGKIAIMNGTSLTKALRDSSGRGEAQRYTHRLGSLTIDMPIGLAVRGLLLRHRALCIPVQHMRPSGNSTQPLEPPTRRLQVRTPTQFPSLYDFLARRHSPSQGRWISPDPSGLAAAVPTNPQTWNRYAYVANNPLSFVDPAGLNRQSPTSDQCDPEYGICDDADAGLGPGGTDGQGPSYYGDGIQMSASAAAWLSSIGAANSSTAAIAISTDGGLYTPAQSQDSVDGSVEDGYIAPNGEWFGAEGAAELGLTDSMLGMFAGPGQPGPAQAPGGGAPNKHAATPEEAVQSLDSYDGGDRGS